MKRETLATSGLFGVSLLIASCCLGPALFLLFGISIGALGSLVALEPYRPEFIVLGGLLLGYAGMRIYRNPRSRQVAECPDGHCETGPRLPLGRIFPIAVFLYVGAISFPWVLGVFYR